MTQAEARPSSGGKPRPSGKPLTRDCACALAHSVCFPPPPPRPLPGWGFSALPNRIPARRFSVVCIQSSDTSDKPIWIPTRDVRPAVTTQERDALTTSDSLRRRRHRPRATAPAITWGDLKGLVEQAPAMAPDPDPGHSTVFFLMCAIITANSQSAAGQGSTNSSML
ncbi:uncharacterized protein RHO17_022750 [Thomomys bottae]